MTTKNNNKKFENDLIELVQKYELYDLYLQNGNEWIFQELREQQDNETLLLIQKHLKNCLCLEIETDETYLIFIEIHGAKIHRMLVRDTINVVNDVIDTILEIIECNY